MVNTEWQDSKPAAKAAKPKTDGATLKKGYSNTNNSQTSEPNLNLKKEKAIEHRKAGTPESEQHLQRQRSHDIKPT